MTDDDKKEVAEIFQRWLYASELEQVIRKIAGHIDVEKRLKDSEKWLDRMPFAVLGLLLGIIIGAVGSHWH